MRIKRIACLLLAALAGAGSFSAQAADYPARPIRLIVPLPAGGTTDILARTAADQLGTALKQPVLVENRPGGNTLIAAQHVVSSAPDGYTLLFLGGASLSNVFNKSVPFDQWTALVPVAPLYEGAYYLVVNSAFPANTLQEFIAYAKSRPGKINYGGFGQLILSMEALKSAAGIDIFPVPYKGSAFVTTALLGNEIQATFDAIVTYRALIQSGKVKVLATGGPTRSSELPNVPTVAESGFPGFQTVFHGGVWAPTGTPREVVNLLNREFNVIARNPQFRERTRNAGAEVMAGSPEEFARTIRAEIEFWAKIAAAINYKPE